MNKKEILELKRRLKKDACTFTRMCGCYVDADRNKVTTIGETFLNLEDEEFYKYLEIAKKVLSGTVGNNILELEFPAEEEAPGGRQQFLMGLRESALKSDELMDAFYDLRHDALHLYADRTGKGPHAECEGFQGPHLCQQRLQREKAYPHRMRQVTRVPGFLVCWS